MIEKGKISQEPFIGILKYLEEAESANLVDWNAMNIASVATDAIFMAFQSTRFADSASSRYFNIPMNGS